MGSDAYMGVWGGKGGVRPAPEPIFLTPFPSVQGGPAPHAKTGPPLPPEGKYFGIGMENNYKHYVFAILKHQKSLRRKFFSFYG